MTLISKGYNKLIFGLAVIGGVLLAVIFVGIICDVTLRTLGFNSINGIALLQNIASFSARCSVHPTLSVTRGT